MNDNVHEIAQKVAENASKILDLTSDEKRVFASITDIARKIYLKNGATIEEVEIAASRALALLTLMRNKK